MSEMWKRWEGQVIDHKYQLRQFLGSTDHSVVFLAEFRDPEPRKAAVKFLSAELPHSEQVLADWKVAQQLKHPNLLPIYSVGRCEIQDMDVIYAAMEYADENLAEILPHRALTPDETREMLAIVVDVLVFLHGKKLTHGHVKPSNIHATGNQLKLSSDTIQPIVEGREMRRERDAYDAPEIPASSYTPAADVWSLGITLVEALTQQPAFLPFNENVELAIPPALREPFREIAGHALHREASARWSSVDIAVHLNPEAAESVKAALAAASAANAAAGKTPVASAAAASAGSANVSGSSASAPSRTPPVAPLSVPLSKEPPLGKPSGAKTPASRPPLPPPPRAEKRPAARPPGAIVLPNYAVPVLAGALALVAVIALPKILRRSTTQSANTAASAPATASKPTAPPNFSNSAMAPAPQVSKPSASSSTSEPNSASNSTPAPARSAPSSPSSSPAILHGSNTAPRKANASPDRGEVLDKILPRPSSSALASIQGTVRVLVKVDVDASGNVSQALLENPGPSKYFAQKSIEAARGWVFLSPSSEGRSVASEWQIRFDFTNSGVNASPKQLKP